LLTSIALSLHKLQNGKREHIDQYSEKEAALNPEKIKNNYKTRNKLNRTKILIIEI
jgi:hypothetical protein